MKRTIPTWILILLNGMVSGLLPMLGGDTAVAVATIKAGYVTEVAVVTGGSGYLQAPSVVLSGGGGQGAAAKAFLADDRVDFIVVTSAGQGYQTAPSVVIEPPPPADSISVRLVPAITVEGPPGADRTIESSPSISGPWNRWTNVIVGPGGTTVVDLSTGSSTRYYRLSGATPGPAIPGMIELRPGHFWMGSPLSDPDSESDEILHEVTLTEPFWICDHEVTQAEFLSVMGYNPSYFPTLQLPVDSVSWHEALLYCQRLTERERTAGRLGSDWAYRLPTEAEWEYAARAGGSAPTVSDLDSTAWFTDNSGAAPHIGKTRKPNALGLHDLLGNVWEWCADAYGDYPVGSITNPIGDPSGPFRVFRGGSWFSAARNCRPPCRFRVDPEYRSETLGFRTVLGPSR